MTRFEISKALSIPLVENKIDASYAEHVSSFAQTAEEGNVVKKFIPMN